jgi:ribosome recycling factor
MSEFTDMAKMEMDENLKALEGKFATLRTGRPSPALLDGITVDYYGVPTPITQVGAIKVPEGNLMTIEPWDKSVLNGIEKAILAANLGVTPNNDGSIIRLPFPAPTEERRREIVKECKQVAEDFRVGIRSIRRDVKASIEAAKKDGEIGEDEERREETALQKTTDEYIEKINKMLAEKEAEVMEI